MRSIELTEALAGLCTSPMGLVENLSSLCQKRIYQTGWVHFFMETPCINSTKLERETTFQ